MKHTPTPWKAEEGEEPLWVIKGSGKFHFIAVTSQGNDEANARRIISCVNACEGIENPEAIKELIEAAHRGLNDHNPEDCLYCALRKSENIAGSCWRCAAYKALANLKKKQ